MQSTLGPGGRGDNEGPARSTACRRAGDSRNDEHRTAAPPLGCAALPVARRAAPLPIARGPYVPFVRRRWSVRRPQRPSPDPCEASAAQFDQLGNASAFPTVLAGVARLLKTNPSMAAALARRRGDRRGGPSVVAVTTPPQPAALQHLMAMVGGGGPGSALVADGGFGTHGGTGDDPSWKQRGAAARPPTAGALASPVRDDQIQQERRQRRRAHPLAFRHERQGEADP